MFRSIFVFSLTLTLVACGSPENREAWRAIGQAACSMSINCDPSSYARGGTGYESSPEDTNSPANSGNTSANPWDNGNGLLDRRIVSMPYDFQMPLQHLNK